jgi:hypothetical protein
MDSIDSDSAINHIIVHKLIAEWFHHYYPCLLEARYSSLKLKCSISDYDILVSVVRHRMISLMFWITAYSSLSSLGVADILPAAVFWARWWDQELQSVDIQEDPRKCLQNARKLSKSLNWPNHVSEMSARDSSTSQVAIQVSNMFSGWTFRNFLHFKSNAAT